MTEIALIILYVVAVIGMRRRYLRERKQWLDRS